MEKGGGGAEAEADVRGRSWGTSLPIMFYERVSGRPEWYSYSKVWSGQ